MKLYILRHGETKWNALRRLQGRADISLNEKGIELAKVTRDALEDIKFDLVFSSPLVRAVETAKIIVNDDTVPFILDERIQEISFGVWEGLSCHRDNYELPMEDFSKFFEDAYKYEPPMGGETIKEIIKRTHNFYNELLNKKDYEDKSILISTHGCATRALLQNVYTDHENFWHGSVPPNCSINIIEVKDGISKLLEEDKIYYDKNKVVSYIQK